MRILVTGGAGFIGSNFVHQTLRDYPADELIIIDKLTYAGNLRNLEGALSDPRVKFVRLDICDPALRESLGNCDAAVHFAAESHVDRSIEDARPFVRTNVEGTWNVIDACRAKGVKRFVHVSTDEVYGSVAPKEKSREDSPLAPTSPYAASKTASDLMVQAAFKTYGFPAIITRCTNNYGPFQFPEKFIPLMISQALAGEALPVYGDGRNVRDWIHVSDHCRALNMILRRGKSGEIYNVSGACELENIEVARRILRILNRPESLVKFIKDRPAHDRRYALHSGKLMAELGWRPSYQFDDGLKETITWYENNSVWLAEARSGEYQKYFEHHYTRETFRF